MDRFKLKSVDSSSKIAYPNYGNFLTLSLIAGGKISGDFDLVSAMTRMLFVFTASACLWECI